MLRIAVAFIAGLAVAVGFYTAPADACGVKLTVKSPRVKKRVSHTAHPSHVLVLGAPPSKKLSRWLKQAGHTVEITKDAKKAKRDDYAVVIADPEKVNEARSTFPNTRVVTRSGSLSSNVRKLERVLAQADSPARNDQPVRVASGRTRRARTPDRNKEPKKIEEPTKSRTEVTESRPTETRVADASSDETSDSTPTVTSPVEPAPNKLTRSTDTSSENTTTDDTDDVSQPVRPKIDDKETKDDGDDGDDDVIGPKPPKEKPGKWSKEIYFASNRDGLTRQQKKLLRGNVRWLRQNPDVNVTIEGHTDASGPDEYNKLLGERRADAVRAFLVAEGIDESRLEVVSYGEERPAYKSARKNRRVALIKN